MDPTELMSLSLKELQVLARELEIKGRSKMNKDELRRRIKVRMKSAKAARTKKGGTAPRLKKKGKDHSDFNGWAWPK